MKYWLDNKHPDYMNPAKALENKEPSLPIHGITITTVTEKQVPDDPDDDLEY